MKSAISFALLSLSLFFVNACKSRPEYVNHRQTHRIPKLNLQQQNEMAASFEKASADSKLECLPFRNLNSYCRLASGAELIDHADTATTYKIRYDFACLKSGEDSAETTLAIGFAGNKESFQSLQSNQVNNVLITGSGDLKLEVLDSEAFSSKVWKRGCSLKIEILEKTTL